MMNKTKIEWTDYTWNPVTGCLYGCWYCYARKLFTRFGKSFEPQFHPERLKDPSKVKEPSKIFCCSVSDLFASWTKITWRHNVLGEIKKCPQHIFQLLTKQPHLIYNDYVFPENVWLGATVTNQDDVSKIEEIKKKQARIKFVSFEPLLGEVSADLTGLDWIIIGKLTGSKKMELKEEWVNKLVNQAQSKGIPIFLKDNLNWKSKLQEFPEI